MDKWSTLDSPQYLFLESNELTIQSVADRMARNPSNVLEQFVLNHTISIVSKSPSVGFSWGCSTGSRKFQVRFMSAEIHKSFTQALGVYVSIRQHGQMSTFDSLAESIPGTVASAFDKDMKASTTFGGMQSLIAEHHTRQRQQPLDTGTASFPNGRNDQNQLSWSSKVSPQQSASTIHMLPFTAADSARQACASLKMPTPLVRNSKTPGEPQISANSVLASSETDTETIPSEELETMFAKFIRDEKNIELCKEVERLWMKVGMRP